MTTALVAGACDGDGTAEITLAPTTTTTVVQTTTTTSTTTPSTTSTTTTSATATTSPLSSPTWSRGPHDAAVMGGVSGLEMSSVTAAGSSLVAVGSDGSGSGADAAVWVEATEH
ncbi:MAG: hypothetical protein IH941_10495 [Acidobacteria bacterium]|nr:hypothetical protein [Acidobacteriota bacterium]